MNCKVTEKIFEVMNMLLDEQKKPREYGGQLLYHSEVGFLNVVHRFPELNVSEMSSLLRITKGAVTQISVKLSKKELLEIYTKTGNKKEKYFRLTTAGEEVRKEHLRFHENSNRNLCNYLKTLDADKTKVIFDFLSHLKDCVPFCEFDCMCSSGNDKGGENENESNTVEHKQFICNA